MFEIIALALKLMWDDHPEWHWELIDEKTRKYYTLRARACLEQSKQQQPPKKRT